MTVETLTAVVPTLGRSPVLEECLEALHGQRPRPQIVLVHSGPERLSEPVRALADLTLTSAERLGFADATNRGFASATSPWLAAVNDDVVVQEGWVRALLDAAESAPSVAALQGANTVLGRPELLDGCGIAWNAWWQATQLFHGQSTEQLSDEPFPIAGASATATLYRRSALQDVALPGGETFDPLFESYYEDVDLALRLAAAGHEALCVPTARAAHVGSATGKTLGRRRLSLIYGNRLLTLWRAVGPAVVRILPRALLRDLLDALRRPGDVPGIVGGWARALRVRGRFARGPENSLSLEQLRRLTQPPTQARPFKESAGARGPV